MLFTFGIYINCFFITLCFYFSCLSIGPLLVSLLLLWVHFFDFIYLLCEFCKRLVVFFDKHIFIYGPVIFFSYCMYVWMCVCMYGYMYVCTNMYVFMYVLFFVVSFSKQKQQTRQKKFISQNLFMKCWPNRSNVNKILNSQCSFMNLVLLCKCVWLFQLWDVFHYVC
jgi:hypothetical protein